MSADLCFMHSFGKFVWLLETAKVNKKILFTCVATEICLFPHHVCVKNDKRTFMFAQRKNCQLAKKK